MRHETTQMTLKATVISLALFAAPAALANSGAPASHSSAALAEPRVAVARSADPQSVRRVVGARGRVGDRLIALETRHGGLTWRDTAIGAGIAIGIVLLGIWGDMAVGVVLLAVGALIDVGVAMVARGQRVDDVGPTSDRKPTPSTVTSQPLLPAAEQKQG